MQTEKTMNILLFQQAHWDERVDKSSVYLIGYHFHKDGTQQLIENNLSDSIAALRSTAPLATLVPKDWNGTDTNTRIVDETGEEYAWGYNINDGKQLYASFWDFYATPEVIADVKKFEALKTFFQKVVTDWMNANGLTPIIKLDQQDVYWVKGSCKIIV